MDVDDIFDQTGQFGRYQIQQYLLLSVPILFSSYQTVAYIFTTGNPVYRCKVPECEDETKNIEFDKPWLSEALPFNSDGTLEQCLRYKPIISSYYSSNFTQQTHLNVCFPYSFNKEQNIQCDSWVFKGDENTIVTEFQIMCPENAWKVALVGSMNYLGFFIGNPVSGIFADRYGRKTVLAISCFIQSSIGLLRSVCPNYETYLALQFFGAFMCGAYNAGFVLGLEIVGPKKRVLGNAIICCFHSTGEAIVGLLMWVLKDWRLLSRFLFIPGLFSLIYLWIVPESIRWLIMKGKTEETLKIFNKMAKINKKELTLNFNNNSLQQSNNVKKDTKVTTVKEVPNEKGNVIFKLPSTSSSSITEIIKSKRLILRLGECALCWMVITMVFFGLSLSSVSVAGNKYFNFILTIAVELPGYMSTWLLMDVIKVGRRPSLSLSFLLTGLTCITFNFISGVPWAKFALFLLGKFSITFAFAVVYIHTAEMFPTEVRNSILGICSMSGHIGSMLAPQTTLLSSYVEPLLLWGLFSLLAGAISTQFPETLNTKLPDTVAEAEKIGT
ncbi:organic cation transporter protein [Lycorma delicatula]|uniref:organic cation transporter protein n=1 Tax=Lycorma delicatula TaxID=130591 RepID=UPI003F50F0F1